MKVLVPYVSHVVELVTEERRVCTASKLQPLKFKWKMMIVKLLPKHDLIPQSPTLVMLIMGLGLL